MVEDQSINKDIFQDQQVFNRGGKMTEEYNLGQKVLCCSRCKMNDFDWMKDFENELDASFRKIEEGRSVLLRYVSRMTARISIHIPRNWILRWGKWLLLKQPLDMISAL